MIEALGTFLFWLMWACLASVALGFLANLHQTTLTCSYALMQIARSVNLEEQRRSRLEEDLRQKTASVTAHALQQEQKAKQERERGVH